ncbi:MAG: helix-turn-helix transcriptional regulator [Ekhidna sp.]|nr:helix-turn-helix transcriptional regulator [Ekhidna sp.]MBC6409500.1 helix-turn-helix transcriptional regulator [Ekhidna sp.]MBC6425621.1 helix-turn-helix transcriptional regulator [Ekhidna sp.]
MYFCAVNVGENIRKLRELKGYSQEYMAVKLKMSQRNYSRIEKEESKLDLQKLQQIGEILEVTPVQLIGFDDRIIFNQNNNKEAPNIYNNHFPEKMHRLLQEQYEKRIKQLEDEVAFLRTLVEK